MDLCYGRYLVAAVVYSFLTGNDVRSNPFAPEGSEPDALNVLKQCVHSVLQSH